MDVEIPGRITVVFLDVATFKVITAAGFGMTIQTAVFGRQGDVGRRLQNAARQRAEDALRVVNDQLENRVAERTADAAHALEAPDSPRGFTGANASAGPGVLWSAVGVVGLAVAALCLLLRGPLQGPQFGGGDAELTGVEHPVFSVLPVSSLGSNL